MTLSDTPGPRHLPMGRGDTHRTLGKRWLASLAGTWPATWTTGSGAAAPPSSPARSVRGRGHQDRSYQASQTLERKSHLKTLQTSSDTKR